MLEKLKPLRSTPTGIYFRMADGRIGYANHQYARVSVTREGIRNGQYYKEDCSIGDRMYQINTRINYPHHETSSINMIGRVRYNDISEAINALQNFNCKNCGEYAVELRKNKIIKEYNEHKALNIRSVLTRDEDEAYNRGHDDGRENGYSDGREFGYSEGYKMGKENGYEDGYNEGFSEGVISVEEKLNKLLNTL
jgi:hypothetical protein